MSVATHLGIRLESYDRRIRGFIPAYEGLLAATAETAAIFARRARPAVLDLGIGTGALSAEYWARVPEASIIGVDADEAIMALARRRLARHPSLRLIHGDFRRLRLPTCDAIMATLSLHHIPTIRSKSAFYGRAYTALRPGGVIVNGDCCPASDPAVASRDLAAWKAHLQTSFSTAQAAGYLSAWAKEDVYFTLAQEATMLCAAGFGVEVTWRYGAFAVVAGIKRAR